MDFRVQDQLLFKWKYSGKVVIKTISASNTVFTVLAVSNQWTSNQKTKSDVGSEWIYIEEKDSAWHHSITIMSQRCGHTNSYSLKAMEILTQVSDLIPRGVSQKMGRKKCFFHLLRQDVFRNV